MDYEVGYGKPPRHTRFKQGEASANPRGRPRKNLAASLVEGLNKKVVVTENGRRRKIAVREAITSQLINKSATADLRAIKMLLDLIKDAEKQAGAVPTPQSPPALHRGGRGGRRDADRAAAPPDPVRDGGHRNKPGANPSYAAASSAITTVSPRRRGKHGEEARITKHLLIAFQHAIRRPDY